MRKLIVRRTTRRKVFAAVAILLGLTVTIVLIESSLRIMGWLMLQQRQVQPQTVATADFVILCTGDSHTEGIGAPRGLDYPAQLAARLRQSHPRTRFAVVNLGRAGDNSSQAADRLMEFIDQMPRRPYLIVFNAGKNNDHRFTDARILPAEARNLTRFQQYEYLLANSRALQLGEVTISRLKDQIQAGAPNYRENWDEVLDVHGATERRLLSDWVRRDLEYLAQRTAAAKVPIVMLNYWHGVDTVDDVFADLARQPRFVWVDARGFGVQLSRITNSETLRAPDGHPNQYGYALIARLVEKTLTERRLIPAD